MLGKRAGGRVAEVPTAPNACLRTDEPTLAPLWVDCPQNREAHRQYEEHRRQESLRWWVQVGVAGFRVRALIDTGAARTAMGSLALQIATVCGEDVLTLDGPGARVADGQIIPILGQVRLPFGVAGIERMLEVIILCELDAVCMLGADFCRAFDAYILPRENELVVGNAAQQWPLELASLAIASSNTLTAVELADVSTHEREHLNEMLERLLPSSDAPLGCTNWTQHEIDVGDARPIKQRHYPVLQKIEKEMHAQVREMLDSCVIRRSNSEWSSPVVMVRKANGKYRFCIDYRKLNAVTRMSAYPLPYMDVIM